MSRGKYRVLQVKNISDAMCVFSEDLIKDNCVAIFLAIIGKQLSRKTIREEIEGSWIPMARIRLLESHDSKTAQP